MHRPICNARFRPPGRARRTAQQLVIGAGAWHTSDAALPYELHVNGHVAGAKRTYTLTFANTGTEGANFCVYTGDPTAMPKRYTVEAGKQLSDTWAADTNGQLLVNVFGPNGYFRRFAGSLQPTPPCNPDGDVLRRGQRQRLSVRCQSGTAPVVFTVTDVAYGQPPLTSRCLRSRPRRIIGTCRAAVTGTTYRSRCHPTRHSSDAWQGTSKPGG